MNFTCPLCNATLNRFEGEKIHPGNPEFGVTLDCGNPACSAAEVTGHGRNEKEAFKIIEEKCKFGTKKS